MRSKGIPSASSKQAVIFLPHLCSLVLAAVLSFTHHYIHIVVQSLLPFPAPISLPSLSLIPISGLCHQHWLVPQSICFSAALSLHWFLTTRVSCSLCRSVPPQLPRIFIHPWRSYCFLPSILSTLSPASVFNQTNSFTCTQLPELISLPLHIFLW